MPRSTKRKPRVPSLETLFPGAAPTPGGATPQDVEEADALDDAMGDALELDSETFVGATWNLYRLQADGTPPPGSKVGAYVAKMSGPLDLEGIKREHGGGVYRVIGTLPNRSRFWQLLTVDGPPVVRAAAPTALVPQLAPSLGLDPLAALVAEVRQLRERVEHPAAPPLDPLTLFMGALEAARTMYAPQNQLSAEASIGVLFKGIELGRGIDHEPGFLDVAKEMLPQLLALFPKPVPGPATGSRPPLGVVRGTAVGPVAPGVFTPPTAPLPAPAAAPAGTPTAIQADSTSEQRIRFLASMLATAIERGTPVEELAESACTVLAETELDELEGASAELVLAAIGPARLSLYPALERADAADYLGRFIAALRELPDETSPPS